MTSLPPDNLPNDADALLYPFYPPRPSSACRRVATMPETSTGRQFGEEVMNTLGRLWLVVFPWLVLPQLAFGQIERVWLTHKTNDPSKLVVNWQTAKPGNSV